MLRGGETVCRTKRYLIKKVEKGCTKVVESCEMNGREGRIFLVAPIELLKMFGVCSFRYFIKDIRSLRFNSKVVFISSSFS